MCLNEELPLCSCPSLTQSNALSPRWQHIYIVAMDTTSITLCMALQIKEASLMMMSGELNYVFHTPSKNEMIATLTHEGIKSQEPALKDADRQKNQYCINSLAIGWKAWGEWWACSLVWYDIPSQVTVQCDFVLLSSDPPAVWSAI